MPETPSKTVKCSKIILLTALFILSLCFLMYFDLVKQAFIILTPQAINLTNVLKGGVSLLKEQFTFDSKTCNGFAGKVDTNLSMDLTGSNIFEKDSNVQKWEKHYINGIPIKPSKVMPTCDKFIDQLKHPISKYQLLAMYDPGNCAEIPNTHLNIFENLPVEQEKHEPLASPVIHELTDLCLSLNLTLGDPNWRLCYGMPETYHYGKWVHQRYIYTRDLTGTIQSLGKSCYRKNLAFLFNPLNLDHRGGPRKVLNNLCSGFRSIGKPYVVNARNLSMFDYLYSPDPHHGFFMYYMRKFNAQKFYIGPTVEFRQFNVGRISPPVRNLSHIVAASKNALNTNQYFPGIPLKPKNSVVIPTGVDETIFTPSNNIKTSVLIYWKHGCDSLTLGRVKRFIEDPIIQINYGSYTEDKFRKYLNIAKYAVICDGKETQGIAMEEIMSMDVPLLVINPASVPYFSDDVGVILPQIPEYLPLLFKHFVQNVAKRTYKPREWLIKNLGIAYSAINTMKVFCGLPNTWNPEMNVCDKSA